MGEIRPKRCEGVGITWLPAPLAVLAGRAEPIRRVVQLHFSNFSGVLPPVDYASIPDCTLYNDRWTAASGPGNNVFACPLARGAETCGAVCS